MRGVPQRRQSVQVDGPPVIASHAAAQLSYGTLTRAFFRFVFDDRPPQSELVQDAFRNRDLPRQHLMDEGPRDPECLRRLALASMRGDEGPQPIERVDVDVHESGV